MSDSREIRSPIAIPTYEEMQMKVSDLQFEVWLLRQQISAGCPVVFENGRLWGRTELARELGLPETPPTLSQP